ncbi:MAG: histidine kinase [Eubacteriales bacterium]|nr:histidine kinase [Eubacteriales bacterium]
MGESVKENYFLGMRIGILLILEIYIAMTQWEETEASVKMLLFLALFLGSTVLREMLPKWKWIWIVGSVVLLGGMYYFYGSHMILLGIFLAYEVLSSFKPRILMYFLPVLIAMISVTNHNWIQIMITPLLAFIYIQHDFVVAPYQEQTKEDIVTEQNLKHAMHRRESELQEEIHRGLLKAENQVLEERAQLSQTLHDKLGHNINGSVYQLEAIKVLMEKDPERSKQMTQAVIDQLRTGMDEIRAILRKERPKKYKLAILQLQKLCEECCDKGVEASLQVEGDLQEVPEKYLEIILDNAYEAVSNSMKYAKCTQIVIQIHVLNQMLRCSISDNGVGCSEVNDGMGIAGMRRRVREVNGVLSFETEAGFTINMLLPLQ